MKKKKALTIASLAIAVLFSAFAVMCLVPTALKAGAATWEEVSFEKEYVYGDTLAVPSLDVTAGNEVKTVKAVVTYPDGKASTASEIVLDKAGEYNVEYSTVINGAVYRKTFNFNVKAVAYLLSSEASSALYGDYTEYGANSTGLLVRLANRDKITFTTFIDVKNSTSADAFVKGFITPDTRGAADFNKLVVTLTDSEDDSVYLTYQLKRIVRDGIALGVSYVDVGGNGQDMVGAENISKIHMNDEYGAAIYLSFVAQRNNDGWSDYAVDYAPDKETFRFSYDAATNAAYLGGKIIADMDDSEYYRTLWSGFPSGKARLSISASGYNGSTANFCITEVGGVSAEELRDNIFTDSEAPEITIETEDENEMPKAETGTYYPVPVATAYDVYSGKCDVDVSIYRNYKKDEQINVGISGGKFKPLVAGDYSIVYTAKDNFGNVAEKVVMVRAEKKIDDIKIGFPDSYDNELILGSELVPLNPTIGGGSGKVGYKIYIVYNGVEEEYTGEYRPEKEGVYTVKYLASDYIGKTGENAYTINAVRTNEVTLAEKYILPRVYISGSKYVLPKISVNDYSTGSLEKKSAAFKITDSNGERIYSAGETFIPTISSNGDKVKVACVYDGKSLKETEVPAIIALEGAKVRTDNYFYGAEEISATNENGKPYRRGLASVIGSACDKSGWMFANPLVAEGLSLKLQTVKGLTSFNSFTLVITDSVNSDQSVKVSVRTAANAKVVCGSKTYDTKIDLSVGADLTLALSGKILSVTSGDNRAAVAFSEYSNGDKFDGFSSNKVYMELYAENVTAQSRYIIEEISGNVISGAFGDYCEPMFVLPGSDGGKQTKGTVYTFVKGVCGDVFAPNTTVSMTVYAPDGTIATDIDGEKLENVSPFVERKIFLTKSGKYKAQYVISESEWKGNGWTYAYTVNVPDVTAPEIVFADGIKTAKIGDSVEIPSFTVKDDITADENLLVEVFVINPNGRLIYLGNAASIKCDYKGEYTFIVYAADMIESVGADGSVSLKQGNVATARYVITVGE